MSDTDFIKRAKDNADIVLEIADRLSTKLPFTVKTPETHAALVQAAATICLQTELEVNSRDFTEAFGSIAEEISNTP